MLPTRWTAVIRPVKGWAIPNLSELWAYRELLFFLTWRDIAVRYKQTVLGAAWAVIQPFFSMVVFSIFFGGLAGIPSDGIPYPVFSFAGLLPWTFFANAMSQSANSLVGSANLIGKVYFPRLIVPLASVLSGLVDFAIAFIVLLGMMLVFGIAPTPAVLLLPLFLGLALITALGAGLWLSALNVEYRDVRYVVPFLVQFLMFATPVVYPASLLDQPWRTLYGLNPMVGVVEGFRWALLGAPREVAAFRLGEIAHLPDAAPLLALDPPSALIGISALAALLLLVTGVFYFQRMERTFADVV